MLNDTYDGFVGIATMEVLSKYKFDHSFISAVGIDVFDDSITSYNTNDGYTKNSALKLSKKKILLIEERKYFADGNYIFAKLDDFDTIICDKKPSNDILQTLEKFHVNLI
jgi:DeoR family transcriptional regulator, glycerol-3-phosphate regulon repressor